jgi:hydroxymethylpyrimidine pyrophosphatase-like HAD family hydrolase
MNTAAPKTIFCDIDGTLLLHKGDIVKNIIEEPVLLQNVIDTIKQWEKLNYKIILTTGRKECTRKQTEQQLFKFGIVYDMLIMGITNGDRIIINDKKPRGIRNTCYAINLVRNTGFENVDLTSKNVTIPDNFLFSKIEKPWGYEELLECNDKYCVKKIFIENGKNGGMLYHELKTKTIVILSGKLEIYSGKIEEFEKKEYNMGEVITIGPYTLISIKCLEDCFYLETSTNELWDDNLLSIEV